MANINLRLFTVATKDRLYKVRVMNAPYALRDKNLCDC